MGLCKPRFTIDHYGKPTAFRDRVQCRISKTNHSKGLGVHTTQQTEGQAADMTFTLDLFVVEWHCTGTSKDTQ